MSNIHIRLIESPTDAQVETAVKIFACAFREELVIRSATGGNLDLCEPTFRIGLGDAKSKGRLYFAISRDEEGSGEEKVVGAAYWSIFEKSKPPVSDAVQQLVDELDSKLDPEVRAWWHDRFLPPIGTILNQYSERVWHLKYLGVLPEARQKGIGKALVLPLRDEAKVEGWNFSLVTQTTENVKFYERLGFRLGGTTIITGGPFGDITAYVMIEGFTNQ